MRLLFLVGRDAKHPRAGGGDLQAWEWARYAVSRGHGVTYICSSQPGLKPAECVEGVRVLRLGSGVLLALRAFRFYRRHRQELDLVYEDVIGGSRPPFLTPLFVTQPIVVAWHQVSRELFYESYPKPLAFAMTYTERALARLYRGVQIRAPSEERRLELHRELGLPLAHIHVIPASIPDDWFVEAPEGPRDGSLVLCLGNMRPYKDFHMAIQAFPQVLQDCHDARLVIAGRRYDAAYEQSLRDLAETLRIAERVEFQLDVTEEEKRALISRSRVLALPSRLEGFGIVALEANACGVPVVASSGVPEAAVRHEYNGLRYPFADIAALASSIVRLLKDDGLYDRLSTQSLAFAGQFGWRQVGAQFEGLLELARVRKAESIETSP
jgi:glycosyltransferase involved in cell wall biosynthesis